MSSSIILRVRSQVGIWRVHDLNSFTSIKDIRKTLSKEHNIDLSDANSSPITLTPGINGPVARINDTVGGLKLKNGDMLYLHLNEKKINLIHEDANGPKKISCDGTIIQQPYEEILQKSGFRPGRLSLKDIKMKWTLADFITMDDQFTYKIKRQEKAFCERVSMESNSCNLFQNYVREFGFHRSRVAYLYGKIDENNNIKVECMYEPPQENSSEGFILLEDPMEKSADILSSFLGLEKVGWIFAHSPREEGFQFNSTEIIIASEMQIIAAGGVNEHPFVTVKVTIDSESNVHFDAFQVSKQCMEMVAEEALLPSENPGYCKVAPSFTAIVEGKPTQEVNNNFFLTVVPIEQHESEIFSNIFIPANREGSSQQTFLKKHFQKAGSKGYTYIDLISDFNLLLFLSKAFDMNTDMEKICRSVLDKSISIPEGYLLLINQLAGIDD